jgi:hypothetical protein
MLSVTPAVVKVETAGNQVVHPAVVDAMPTEVDQQRGTGRCGSDEPPHRRLYTVQVGLVWVQEGLGHHVAQTTQGSGQPDQFRPEERKIDERRITVLRHADQQRAELLSHA